MDLPEAIVQPNAETEEQRLLREEQAKNAHYSFGTSIDDRINDHSIHRQETRNGLALRGMYSYSDGFYHRTIHYEADENGYRVVKLVAKIVKMLICCNCNRMHLKLNISPISVLIFVSFQRRD